MDLRMLSAVQMLYRTEQLHVMPKEAEGPMADSVSLAVVATASSRGV
jgi:hypothetical protein